MIAATITMERAAIVVWLNPIKSEHGIPHHGRGSIDGAGNETDDRPNPNNRNSGIK
ncbi:hypothetical protein [Phyllobacterium sophorae]|uniref:hypothetical protein n=1 Tax=Phyllobacterium sophorae TaxID=1520277 RepID=UPI001AECA0F1|nr:hypothetical protein [Phyllobacterium sophorae]